MERLCTLRIGSSLIAFLPKIRRRGRGQWAILKFSFMLVIPSDDIVPQVGWELAFPASRGKMSWENFGSVHKLYIFSRFNKFVSGIGPVLQYVSI